MKKRLLAALVSGALMMSALAGCGGSTAQTNNGGDTADQTTQQDYHIKVILKTLASEYWQYVGNGCKQAGEDLGVTVDVLGASSETAYDEQLSMIETTLSANDCDAMVVAPLQAETVATQIANTDLPIVAIDTAIDSDKVLSFVGVGGNLAGIDAILAGQETMTVAVDGYDVGYLGVQAAVDALNGKKLDEFIATDAAVVTADNAAERRAEVEKRLGQ